MGKALALPIFILWGAAPARAVVPLKPVVPGKGHLVQTARNVIRTGSNALRARLAIEGPLHFGNGPHYVEWKKENASILQRATRGPAGQGVASAAFTERFETLAGAKFTDGDSVKLLVNGPASFAERYRLIDGAKKSIYLATWKVYGDETGKKTVDALLAKKAQSPDLDIRVVVDGNVAVSDPQSVAQLKRLVDAKIPVAFYHHNQRPWDGHHYKSMIVDAGTAEGTTIAGGMNIGDEYSHAYGTPKANDPNRQQWRDTDVMVKGPSVWRDAQLFAHIWDSQVAQGRSKVDPFHQQLPSLTLGSRRTLPAAGAARVLVTVDQPGPTSQERVTNTMVVAAHAAQHTIDLENAYVMNVPVIRDSLLEAMKRGVRVRVLTNSPGTIDQTIVSAPIQEGVQALLAGAEAQGTLPLLEVYERKKLHPGIHNGDTLHSKMMVVDGELAQVTSYNVHARSMRLEVEGAHWVQDHAFASSVVEQFGKDIAPDVASRVATSKDVVIPGNAASKLLHKLHFDPVNL